MLILHGGDAMNDDNVIMNTEHVERRGGRRAGSGRKPTGLTKVLTNFKLERESLSDCTHVAHEGR